MRKLLVDFWTKRSIQKNVAPFFTSFEIVLCKWWKAVGTRTGCSCQVSKSLYPALQMQNCTWLEQAGSLLVYNTWWLGHQMLLFKHSCTFCLISDIHFLYFFHSRSGSDHGGLGDKSGQADFALRVSVQHLTLRKVEHLVTVYFLCTFLFQGNLYYQGLNHAAMFWTKKTTTWVSFCKE